MTKDKKQELINRIANANKTEMIVVLYDMTLAYFADAREKTDIQQMGNCLKRAKECIDELKRSVNFNVDPGAQIYAIYTYLNKQISRAIISGKTEPLDDCEKILLSMRKTWEKLAQMDSSKPVMENAEMLAAGFTYGKKDLNLNPVALNNRGFLV